MAARLEPNLLRRDGQAATAWFVRLPPGTRFEDAMAPGFWRAVAETVNVRDLVRVLGPNLEFDCLLTVVSRGGGGLKMVLFPVLPATGASNEQDNG